MFAFYSSQRHVLFRVSALKNPKVLVGNRGSEWPNQGRRPRRKGLTELENAHNTGETGVRKNKLPLPAPFEACAVSAAAPPALVTGPTDHESCLSRHLSGRAGWVLPGGSGRNRSSGTSIHFTPVVYTCGVPVLRELRRTKAVLGGLYGVVSTQKVGSEKAG